MRTKVTDLHPHRYWYESCFGATGNRNNTEIGHIHLNEGTVCFYKCDFFVSMNINFRGKLYEKNVFGKKSRRFCTTLAKRFMAEVVELSNQGK